MAEYERLMAPLRRHGTTALIFPDFATKLSPYYDR